MGASPNFVHEQFLHPDCITIWYGFAADFILDSLFIRRTFLKVVQDIPSQFWRPILRFIIHPLLRLSLAVIHFVLTGMRPFRDYRIHAR